MQAFRRRSLYRTLLVWMTVFGLLLQVESSFACKMMDDAGPAKECCCGHKNIPNPDTEQSPCCDFSLDLSFKNIDTASPLLIVAQSIYTPIDYPVASGRFDWPPPSTPISIPDWNRDFDSGHSGTDTYLTTLRLRI